jgi:hypothetical protein
MDIIELRIAMGMSQRRVAMEINLHRRPPSVSPAFNPVVRPSLLVAMHDVVSWVQPNPALACIVVVF